MTTRVRRWLTRAATRPKRPYLIMNPRSGGGKVTKFHLKEKAEGLGAEVALPEAKPRLEWLRLQQLAGFHALPDGELTPQPR